MTEREKAAQDLLEVRGWLCHLQEVGFLGDVPQYRQYEKWVREAIRLLNRSEWISVEDRLPEEEGLYLCWFGKNKHTKGALMCNYIADLGGFGSLISLEKFDKITHWMPLPEGPEEGDAGE